MKMRKIDNGKIKVACFVIKSGNHSCQMLGKCHEMRQMKLLLLFFLSQVILGYKNGILLAKFELLIDRTSSIYLKDILNIASIWHVVCQLGTNT
jgi:hypothetical protein